MIAFPARTLVEGSAEGLLTLWSVPLSFWGGYDSRTGQVIDRSHPAFGSEVSGRILAMPSGRGSSSASSVLAEAIRCGTAPAGIILSRPDPIITVGAIVAARLYGKACPVVVCDPGILAQLADDIPVSILAQPSGATINLSAAA
jgi:predicted aconitase with swiveling domain